MNILVSNDDGIFSEGIYALAKSLSREHNVLVVAPDGNRSAASHSITLGKSFRVEKVRIDDNFNSFAVYGTPADCVKFALTSFTDFKCDLVCAGINAGYNMGNDIRYSGTVAAALEANNFNLPAIAVSTDKNVVDYSDMCDIIQFKIIDKFKDFLKGAVTFNVNVPPDENRANDEIFITVPAGVIFKDEYVLQPDGSYLLTGEPDGHELADKLSDFYNVFNGRISLTPLRYDATDVMLLNKLTKGY